MYRGLGAWGLLCLLVVGGCGSDDSEGGNNQSGGTVELGGECLLTADCKGKDVACDCDGTGPTKCVALLPAGASCEGQTSCVANALCINQGQGAICVGYKAAGESCESQDYCAAGSTCKEGVCAPASAIGEPCGNFEPRPCAAGSYCDFFDELCVAQKTEGQECGGKDECLDGVCYSQGGPQVCHPKRKEGEACESSFQCPESYDCEADVCTKPTSPTTCF